MIAAQLMTDLARLGIRIEAHGDRLRCSPRSAVTPDLVGRLKAHKGELLAILRRDPEAPATRRTDANQVWQAALDRLEGDPLFPPDVMEGLRAADARWAGDPSSVFRLSTASTVYGNTLNPEKNGNTVDVDSVDTPETQQGDDGDEWDSLPDPDWECPQCGGLLWWENIFGERRCVKCRPSRATVDDLQRRCERVRKTARRSRRR